ncbi:hypothetical protein OBBRIDRAFT_827905 [Obba rivulosa]|uniref:Peptidase S54 rhomboid domain-containing protein n=1 Tax=Obba rivulosa TaxID=1052685 RepID=A0A8E2AMS9_9APHY|nr:hypothetical protein OBBRIDRAFT_827905 [Obba rivulosa]
MLVHRLKLSLPRFVPSNNALYQVPHRRYGTTVIYAIPASEVLSAMPVRTTRLVIRPTLFVLASVLGVYTFCAYETNNHTDFYLSQYPVNTDTGYWIVRNADQARQCCEIDKTTERSRRWKERLDSFLPAPMTHSVITTYIKLATMWNETQDSDRTLLGVTALTTAIFASRLLPGSLPHVLKLLFHHPFSGRSHTLITSPFNHLGMFHLVSNIGGLWFLKIGYQWLAQDCLPEQLSVEEATSSYHLLSFTFAAGAFSMLCSHLYEIALYRSRVRSLAPPSLAALTFNQGWQVTPTCGISGVVYALAAVAIFGFSDNKAHLIFANGDIPAWTLIIPLLALDTAGLLAGRRLMYMNHACHLSGFAFGTLYVYYGVEAWEKLRIIVARVSGGEMPAKVLFRHQVSDNV